MSQNVLVVPEGKLVDYVDGSFRPDKPEEWVRQNISKRLVNSLKYPKTRIAIEKRISMGSSKPRVDIALFEEGKPHQQEHIKIIVECKRESISPADRKDGVGQLKSYMSACLNCEWGLWTNGKHREVWRKTADPDGKTIFLEEVDLPSATGKKLSGRSRSELTPAVGDILLFAFRTAHNSIHVVDGFQKEKAFFELLKIVFCKISDEKNIPNPLEFYVAPEELRHQDGQHACKKRISKIFQGVKSRFKQIFPKNEEIDLDSRSLVRIVAELQNFSLLRTDIDIKGKAYEEIVGANLKGDRGQFFTPRNMMSMAVQMLNPKQGERVLDPACGTAGFVVIAMLHVLNKLESSYSKMLQRSRVEWSNDELRAFDDKVNQLASEQFFGFDITPELVKAAKMNMVMNNDGSGNMLHADSLLPPYMWSDSFRKSFVDAINKAESDIDRHLKAADITTHNDISLMDVIVTNPPFGTKILIKDTSILEQYDLGHIWEKPKKGEQAWKKTSRLQGGVPPEQLFIERCVQFLKEGGRMAIVVPDSILGSPGLGYIRQWLLTHTRILASIDFDSDAFQPHTGVQTSILMLEKKTREEIDKERDSAIYPYNVFMAIVDKVGHDKRGVTTYKRDLEGREIAEEVEEMVPQEDGSFKVEKRTERVVDDQTSLIPRHFEDWKVSEGLSW